MDVASLRHFYGRFFINDRIINVDVKEISDYFEQMDGILTEPELGPYYLEQPYYLQTKELFENKLVPLYNDFFREAYKLLKNKGRICFIGPIINTIDGNDVQIDIREIASKNNFTQIPLLNQDRFFDKANPKLQFLKKSHKTLIDAKKGQIIKRKIFVFENSSSINTAKMKINRGITLSIKSQNISVGH